MTRLSLASVTPELAIDILYVMGVAMRIDAKVEPGERKALDAAARTLGLGSFATPSERPNAFRLDRTASERALLFASAVWMILADGQVGEAEHALFADLASRLQLDAPEAERLTTLARDSFTVVDGPVRDWSVAYGALVHSVLTP